MRASEKISIIVPVYNVEKYLDRCINSILKQTYQNLEIILVDDGSNDNSGNMCDKYAQKDSRIRVIHKENGGLSDARNKGIEIATGEYIGFVDSDDYIADNMYEYLKEIMDNNDADISICGYTKFSEKDNIIESKDYKEYVYTTKEAIRELIKQEKFQDYAWNKLYKSKLFSEILYPFGRKMEDIGTTYKLFDASKKIVFCNKTLYYYFQRENSIVNNKKPSLYIDKYELSKERYLFIKKKYPSILENDIDMLNKILSIYKQKKNKQIYEYLSNHDVMKLYFDIMKNIDKFKNNIPFKMKLKILLFKIYNYKEYRSI